MATVWYKQVNPPQRKALFSAWLGYVFDGFDFMMMTQMREAMPSTLSFDDFLNTVPSRYRS